GRGNAGTGGGLLLGLLATHPLTAFRTGDASLRGRPMARVATPLTEIGARIVARDGCRLPLAIIGTADPVPITYRLPVASAQVKSAVLLGGLHPPRERAGVGAGPTRGPTRRVPPPFRV